MKDIIYLVALHYIGISQKKLNIIFNDNEDYKGVLDKINYNFLKSIGIQDRYIKIILSKKEKLNFDFLENKLKERYVKVVTIKDKNYPKLLKEIPNTPYLLYVRGRLDNSLKISVVGSRAITTYGKKVIESIVPGLSRYFTIVSGGAYGCDTYSHKAVLENNNKTIVIPGTGIDIDYPVANKTMYDDIVETGGAIVSIFPIGELGKSYNFPIRNEIVVGLSIGTLVVEAQERSGSLITANLTLDLARDLFAISGDIFKVNSKGCNNLIKNGEAKLVLETKDILEEYNIGTIKNEEKNNIKFADKIEEQIYNLLLLESFNSDELSKKLKMNISPLVGKLSIMEISGIIKKGLGGKYEVK